MLALIEDKAKATFRGATMYFILGRQRVIESHLKEKESFAAIVTKSRCDRGLTGFTYDDIPEISKECKSHIRTDTIHCLKCTLI